MNYHNKSSFRAIPVYLVVLCFATQLAMAGGRIVSFGYSSSLPAENGDIKSVAAGYMHSLAVNDAGKVIAWGDNRYGQSSVPSSCLTGITKVAANGFHSMALNASGRVIAWGDASFGQATVPSTALSDVKDIAAGLMHSMALSRTGRVISWGDASFGQIYVPAGLSRVVAISAGALHSVALRNDGAVFIWGDNSFGQGVVPERATLGIKAIAAGYFHNLALTTNGEVIAWGDNTFGQCNVPAAARQGIVAIAAGQDHSLALTANGSLVTWGGRSGQVTFANAIPNLSAISAGGYHSLGIVPEEADTNGNGLPDWWELQNEFDPSAALNPYADSDQDGMCDKDEYLTGTDPWDNTSYFRVNLVLDPATGEPMLAFEPVSTEHSYTLEYAADPAKGPWRAVSGKTNVRMSSDAAPALMSVADSKEFKLYRIRVSGP